jgi:hypothetical protein
LLCTPSSVVANDQVELQLGGFLQLGFSFGHNITAGQTYGKSYCRDNTLTVVAGRHSSDAMAIGFKNAVEAMRTTNWGGSGQDCASPSQLNFYVEVNVTFTQVSTHQMRHQMRQRGRANCAL